MIWVLLEITLPLCLAFLSGIGAGWLCWRWRRRSISQSEWEKHADKNTADSSDSDTLEKESATYQKRAEQLEITLAQHLQKLSETEKQTQSLSVELKSAKTKLAAYESGNSEPNQVTQASSQDSAELEQALAREKKQAGNIEELEFRSQNLQKTVDQQSNELQLFSRDIKRLSAELKIANEKLANQDRNVEAEELLELQSAVNSLKEEKTQTEQKLKEVTTEANLQKNTVKELTQSVSNLENIIERQADELLQAKRNTQKLTEQVESNPSDSTDSGELDEKLLTLQSEFESIKTDKDNAEQQLNEFSGKISEKDNTIARLQSTIDTLEETAKNQSAALQEAETKLKTMSEDSKADMDNLLKQNQTSTEDFKALQSKLQETENQKEQLDKKLQEVSSRVTQQTNVCNELQQKLKQSESAINERDTAVAKIKQLEDELTAACLKSTELEQAKTQLDEVNQKFRNFQSSTLANRQQREEQLNKQKTIIETLKNALDSERAKLSESNKQQQQQNSEQNPNLQQQLNDAKSKLQEVTTQLANVRNRNNQLSETIKTNQSSAPVTPISVAQVNKLKKVVASQDKKIEELEKRLQSGSKKQKPAVNKKPSSWQKGQTKLGTPGCDHKDDLKVIKGIGPKIETLLNKLGIKSWEQLATLKAAEINKVDEALVDFSGRIKRDEWVEQAKAIIRNNHQVPGKQKEKTKKTPAKATKKATKKATAKKSSGKSNTKFGTPGSTHKDDLKAINGIGPVIEKSLNKYGIKSWEQLAGLKVKEVNAIDEKLGFPGRINREQWVAQAKALVKQFPDSKERPARYTLLKKAAGL